VKVFKLLLDKIIVPIIVAISISIVTSIGSKIFTGNWWEWFASVPMIVWVALIVIFIIWIIVIVIRNRIKHLHGDGHSPITILSIPYGEWQDIGKITYAGVIWIVRAPKPSWYELDPEPVSAYDLDLQTPPRCPKCETEIEQTRSFWGGYIWKCVGCGFKKRNSERYIKEKERAEKIARRSYEIQLSKSKRIQ